jgi:hypothetical protein
MPFQPITELPAANPTVRIFFHGLLVLHSPDGTYCLAEPHFGPHAVAHALSIEVRIKSPNNPDVILLRQFGKPSNTVSIEVRPAQAPHAYKYQPSPVFNPTAGSGTGLERDDDFRWIIDFQQLHPARTLTIDTGKTRPGIIFLNGSYFFLTPQRKLNVQVDLAPGNVATPPPDRTAIASIIGAYVYLDSAREEKLVLKWGAVGTELPLEIPEAEDAYYEIYIENSPLFAGPGSSHDEFAEYYGIIKDVTEGDVPEAERLTISFPNEPAFTEGSAKFSTRRMTPRIPCQPVVLEG